MSFLRRKLVRRAGVVFVLVAALGVAGLYLWHDRPGTFTRGNFDRVRIGMTYEEVVGILGPPEMIFVAATHSTNFWSNATAVARVTVTADGAVVSKDFEKRPLADTLRHWWYCVFRHPAPF